MGKSPKPRAARKSRADAEPPARREEVLETALTLVSELGVAGASLRKLAAELGISQPSLYHYFPSKDALVSAVVEYCADKMLASALDLPPPQRKEDIPRFAMRAVVDLWSTERHPRFVRFMFVVALESKRTAPSFSASSKNGSIPASRCSPTPSDVTKRSAQNCAT